MLYKDTDKIMNKNPMDKTEDMIIRLVRGFENMLPVFWLLFNENIDDISVYICVCVVWFCCILI